MNARDSSLDPASRDELLAGLAEIRLLTVDGADFRRVGVEASDGVVTLSGEVKTDSERKQAAAVVRKVDGVDGVNNHLEVVREGPERSPAPLPKARIRPNSGLDPTFEAPHGAETSRQILENASSDRESKAKGVQ